MTPPKRKYKPKRTTSPGLEKRRAEYDAALAEHDEYHKKNMGFGSEADEALLKKRDMALGKMTMQQQVLEGEKATPDPYLGDAMHAVFQKNKAARAKRDPTPGYEDLSEQAQRDDLELQRRESMEARARREHEEDMAKKRKMKKIKKQAPKAGANPYAKEPY